MAETHIPIDHAAVKAEPVITGIGTYRTAQGLIVEIKCGDGGCWYDQPLGHGGHGWTTDGSSFPTVIGQLSNIVARVDGNAMEPAKQVFRITGPGRYRDGLGKTAVVKLRDAAKNSLYPWFGLDSSGDPSRLTDEGEWCIPDSGHALSLVAGPLADDQDDLSQWICDCADIALAGLPLPPKPVRSRHVVEQNTDEMLKADGLRDVAGKREPAELNDFVCIRPGYAPMETTHPERYGPAWTIIDLSTITKDQLVQPKPEPKKVKQTILLAVRKNGTVFTVGDRDSFRPWKNHLDAIIEHEVVIEYTPGEGLGDES